MAEKTVMEKDVETIAKVAKEILEMQYSNVSDDEEAEQVLEQINQKLHDIEEALATAMVQQQHEYRRVSDRNEESRRFANEMGLI